MVAIVVLSWNGREDTLGCLRSLAALEYEPKTVIVVDNASEDGSAPAVRAEFPGVDLIVNERNLGYAGGMNAGIRRAQELGADHVLLLNNDIEVDAGFLGPLVAEARRRTDAAALCPVVHLQRPSERIWYAGAAFDPRRGYNGRQRSTLPPSVTDTDRACGAAMLVPAAALERVGLLDERLFAYGEDTDWSLRAAEAGYALLVVPESRVWHRVSATTGGEGSPAALYYSVRNTLAVCERHAPLGPVGTWRRRAVALAAHAAQALFTRRRRAALGAVREGWHDFRAGRFGPR